MEEFKKLKIGDAFLAASPKVVYIKVSTHDAVDSHGNILFFQDGDLVEPTAVVEFPYSLRPGEEQGTIDLYHADGAHVATFYDQVTAERVLAGLNHPTWETDLDMARKRVTELENAILYAFKGKDARAQLEAAMAITETW